MGTSKHKTKNTMVNKYRLIYMPIIIALITLFIVSISNYYITKYLLIEQMKEDGTILAMQTVRQIEDNTTSLNSLYEMLEEKIKITAEIVLQHEETMSDDLLRELQKSAAVDELNWYSPEGEILYSNFEGHPGWKAFEGHPLYDFISNNEKELMEDIRQDAITGIPFKYGSIKNIDGNFVQVGILAENVYALTEKFSYQTMVETLAKEENIFYALIIDTDLKAIADSDIEDIGITYLDDEEYREAMKGNATAVEWYYPKIDDNILEVATPIFVDNEIIGALGIGLSMKKVYASIYMFSTISFVIAFIMFLIFLWIQNRNIIKPVSQLDQYIHRIDIENNVKYRLPLLKTDTFFGLAFSINNLLDKTHSYFNKIKETQEELYTSNREISAAYEQLAATEEELRTQFDEIQNYTEKLENLKQKYEIAITGTNSAVWEIDIAHQTIYFSEAFKNIVGVTIDKKENIHEVLNQLFLKEDKEKLIKEFMDYQKGEKKEIYIQIQIKNSDDHLKWVLIHGKGIYDASKNLKLLNGILLDISEMKKQEQYVNYLAYHDPLTSLPNRRKFIKKLKETIENQQSGAVMLLDLDNFKEINDTLGHIYGDRILEKVAQEFEKLKEEKLFVSRFGGDEFLILVENEKNIAKIEGYAKKITDIFKNKLKIEEDQLHISSSIGITLYPSDSNEVNQLIMNADMAMYKVKNNGKNGYIFFQKEMIEKLKEKAEVEKILRGAIKEEAFKLVYQPQICTFTGKIAGFEALLRLRNHPISPALFISVAEETGMIIEIGRWVTKQVINQLSMWEKMGYTAKPIAINFSAKQLNDLDYIVFLQNMLEETNVNGKYIDIEITESIFLDKKGETIEFLNKLKALGVKITIDDFGTGYSSLSYLTFLPIDKIKLDKSINDKFLELNNARIMDSLVSLAHSLNLEVVAEGIEDINQYRRLKIAGCNYIQGYLFSKPLEVEDAEKIYYNNFLEMIE